MQKEEKLDITILRGEVVLKETRFKSSYEPYGNGAIGYLKLYSFYQDRDSSSRRSGKRDQQTKKRASSRRA